MAGEIDYVTIDRSYPGIVNPHAKGRFKVNTRSVDGAGWNDHFWYLNPERTATQPMADASRYELRFRITPPQDTASPEPITLASRALHVRAAILKILNPDSGKGGSGAVEVDTALGQLLNEAVTADKVVDIYQLAGVETPELSILSDEFLDSLAHKDKPNLQMGLLRRLLNDQIHTVKRTNIVQGRKFSEMLDEAINRYTNRTLTTTEIIAELVELAKQMRDDDKRHAELGLREDEVAFYDAIVQNDAAVLELGDDVLKEIAQRLVKAVCESATIDWNLKSSVRAAMRSKIRRLLAKYDYPPDAEKKAIELVLEQAELFAKGEVD